MLPRMMHHRLPIVLLTASLLSGCNRAAQESSSNSAAPTIPLTVAAASDLKFALDDLLVDFHKQEPWMKVQVTYGSSGNFFTQLQNQAPFDLYLSADIDYVRKLNEAGKILPDGEFKYAEGRIAVWVRNESKLDVTNDGTAALKDPAVQKIAIANPQHAPYGRAAVAALKHFGLYEQLESKLVQGENIAQAAQFVESGAADVGIIALSLATAPAMKERGRFAVIPIEAHPKLEQAGAILTWTKFPVGAYALRSYLTSPAGRSKLQQYGFVIPGE